MLSTNAIEQFDPIIPGVFAFRVTGELSQDDLEAMAEVMNKAFDRWDEVDMLISFESDEGATLGAGLNTEVIKSQFRSLSNVRKYCVAGAPDGAEKMIDFFGSLLPIEAKSFNSEHNALEHLRAAEPPRAKAA